VVGQTSGGAALVVAAVNEVHHLPIIFDGANLIREAFTLFNGVSDKVPDELAGVGILAENIGVLFSHDGVSGKSVEDGTDNRGLCTKIGNWRLSTEVGEWRRMEIGTRHGGFVFLGYGAFYSGVVNVVCKD
jgi:hypothetical protein